MTTLLMRSVKSLIPHNIELVWIVWLHRFADQLFISIVSDSLFAITLSFLQKYIIQSKDKLIEINIHLIMEWITIRLLYTNIVLKMYCIVNICILFNIFIGQNMIFKLRNESSIN